MPDTAVPDVFSALFSAADTAEVFLVVGGVMASVAVTLEAREILEAAPGLMVRQPLARYRNPLALCDYHTEAAPYRSVFHTSLTCKGRGAAGRPATKHAFMHALGIRCQIAMHSAPFVRAMPLVAEAYEAFAGDEGYVAAMSKLARSVLERQRQWAERSEARAARRDETLAS